MGFFRTLRFRRDTRLRQGKPVLHRYYPVPDRPSGKYRNQPHMGHRIRLQFRTDRNHEHFILSERSLYVVEILDRQRDLSRTRRQYGHQSYRICNLSARVTGHRFKTVQFHIQDSTAYSGHRIHRFRSSSGRLLRLQQIRKPSGIPRRLYKARPVR